MAKSYKIYCNGHRCLLRTNCKRYLYGQRTPANLQHNDNKHRWIDNCDEESREMFEPEKKSE